MGFLFWKKCKHLNWWNYVCVCIKCGKIAVPFNEAKEESPAVLIINGFAISKDNVIKAIDFARKHGVFK